VYLVSVSIVNMEDTAVDIKMDVHHRWLCVIVTSCGDVRNYVDIKVLYGLLQNNLNLSNFRGNRLSNLYIN